MAKPFFLFSIFGALIILGGVLPTVPAKAESALQAVHLCKASNIPDDKIRYCTIAMRNTSDRRVLERLYLRRGNAFMELKHYDDAVSDFTKLIQINPTIAGYFDNRRGALSALGLDSEALEDADREVSLAPNKAFVFHNRGLVLENLQRYDAAIRDFDRAADIDPLDNGLVVDRARVKRKAGHPSEAISDLSRVISVEPSNLPAYKERGIAYAAIGNFAAAESDLMFYARAVPNDPEVARAIDEMNSGRSVGRTPSPPPSPPPPYASTAPAPVAAQNSAGGPVCSSITDRQARLDCYDKAQAARPPDSSGSGSPPLAAEPAPSIVQPSNGEPRGEVKAYAAAMAVSSIAEHNCGGMQVNYTTIVALREVMNISSSELEYIKNNASRLMSPMQDAFNHQGQAAWCIYAWAAFGPDGAVMKDIIAKK